MSFPIGFSAVDSESDEDTALHVQFVETTQRASQEGSKNFVSSFDYDLLKV